MFTDTHDAETQYCDMCEESGKAIIKLRHDLANAKFHHVLNPGELYAGLLIGKNGAPDQHIILLPGEAQSVIWGDAMKFATEAGGDLPTRREQALLFANLPEEFAPEWYWSSDQYESAYDRAYVQNFGDGRQSAFPRSVTLMARAVRRLAF